MFSSLPLADLLRQPAVAVAPQLIGALFRHESAEGAVTVRLTEVEAYLGPADSTSPDPGSHAFRGRTPRNAAMFGPPAHLYVYFVYGMHFCVNVVCGPAGEASACLLRAGEVVEGQELARTRRLAARKDSELARGPARLATALGLTRDHDGVAVDGGAGGGKLTLQLPQQPVPRADIATGPRVGVSGLGGSTAYPWRFWQAGSPTVSRFRAAPPRRATMPPANGVSLVKQHPHTAPTQDRPVK